MAITGKLVADFSGFLEACQKAEVSLRSFETNANKVGTSLNRMADSFSGKAVIQQATLMSQAVEKMGGTSKLTESELARLHRTASEAADKMRLLGVEGADAMAKLAKETEKHPPLLQRITNALGPVGTAMAGAFTATAIIGTAKKVLDFADNVTNLSQRLGVSTDTIQRWQALFGQSGVEINTVAKAATELANRVIGGDKSATAALEKMGIKAQSLKGMGLEQMFYTVADAVGNLQDQGEKIYAGKTLFGKGGVELLQGLNGHLKDTAKELDTMGLIIDNKTIKAADDFGDQLGLMGKQLLGIVATIVGPLLPALSAIGTALTWVGRNVIEPVFNVAIKTATSVIEMFWAGLATVMAKLGEWAQRIPLVGSKLGFLTSSVDWLRESAAKTTAHVDSLWRETDKVGESAKSATPKLIGLGDANDEGAKAARQHASALDQAAEKAKKLQEAWLASAKPMIDYRMRIIGLAPVLDDFNARVFKGADGIELLDDQVIGLARDLPRAGSATSTAGNQISTAFGHVSTILNSISGKFAEVAAIAARTGEAIVNSLAKGDVIGATVAGITGAISAIGKLFSGGPSAEELKAIEDYNNALKESERRAQALVGAFDDLDVAPVIIDAATRAMKNAEGTGAEFDAQLKTIKSAIEKIPAGFQALESAASKTYGVITPKSREYIETLLRTVALTDAQRLSLQNLLSEGNTDYKGLVSLAGEYGITLDQLGPKFQQGVANQDWNKLYSDWQLLSQLAGPEGYEGMIRGISPRINDMVLASRNAGTTIPEYMRPTLEAMLRMGTLTDGAGGYLKDLKDIKFAPTDPLPGALDKLDGVLSGLVDAIMGENGLIAALDRLNTTPLNSKSATLTYDTVYTGGDPNVPGTPNWFNNHGTEDMATGGVVGLQHAIYAARGRIIPFVPRGTDTVPAMLTPGEGVVNLRGMRYLGAGGLSELNSGRGPSGSGDNVIHVHVNGVWDPATVNQMSDAVGNALLRKTGRKFRAA